MTDVTTGGQSVAIGGKSVRKENIAVTIAGPKGALIVGMNGRTAVQIGTMMDGITLLIGRIGTIHATGTEGTIKVTV